MIKYLTGLSPIEPEMECRHCNKRDTAGKEIQEWLVTMTVGIKWIVTQFITIWFIVSISLVNDQVGVCITTGENVFMTI